MTDFTSSRSTVLGSAAIGLRPFALRRLLIKRLPLGATPNPQSRRRLHAEGSRFIYGVNKLPYEKIICKDGRNISLRAAPGFWLPY